MKPERNTALRTGSGPDLPVSHVVRLPPAITAPVSISVLNRSVGETGGLSDPITIEVAREAIPPRLLQVGLATESELLPLKRFSALAPKSVGDACSTYEPTRRYMTIRADDL